MNTFEQFLCFKSDFSPSKKGSSDRYARHGYLSPISGKTVKVQMWNEKIHIPHIYVKCYVNMLISHR